MTHSVVWTVGHSTRPIQEFLNLLLRQGIRHLVDVRAIPFSRRNPQFNQDALAKALESAEIAYSHMPALGGRRKSRTDSKNTGWRNASFRAYADYMQTPDFQAAIKELTGLAADTRTVIMCAEVVPWRCHRSLISDACIAQGWTVLEIVSEAEPKPHTLPAWATMENGQVTYPGQGQEQLLL
ncbi:MAG TPA: DUF488 domain-containing protein [Nitrospirales bacterium]|jgi:uncharacterized protein (DUF488 family)